MKPRYSLTDNTCVIEGYNQARPFSSFLPGIAGPLGKPMWVFYTNRGQCLASFGVRNKNSAMLEFYPANKAYAFTPLQGFRTFIRLGRGPKARLYEPFGVNADTTTTRQILKIRPQEIELEEINNRLGLRIRVVYFNVPHEALPVLIRQVEIENIGRRPLEISLLDGLPQVVPYGLPEGLLKQMSRTMEAFAEVRHVGDQIPFFKLKIEPSDRPVVEWINGGFFAFAQDGKQSLPIVVDPEVIFGANTSFEIPIRFAEGERLARSTRTESLTACAFSQSSFRLLPGALRRISSYYGQADAWEDAERFRKRVTPNPEYPLEKRRDSAQLLSELTAPLELHSGIPSLTEYSRQSFLDNFLRGGQPMVLTGASRSQVFHYYSRKHGDMERDYNFFELSPTYFSQGNGNFRDVNQNRRTELFIWPGVEGGNVETFFNLLQLDGFNPLIIEFEKFYFDEAQWKTLAGSFPAGERDAWRDFLMKPFNPGALVEKLKMLKGSEDQRLGRFREVLLGATKIQGAAHGEGYWIDHWTYNLDLVDNFAAVYPDRLKTLFIEHREFTYFDSDHVVQPRHKKYVLRKDGVVRQVKAVVLDAEKVSILARRGEDAYKVRTKGGTGSIYRSSLLAKVLGLLAVKAASLDPFGVGIEMEADKPGWCDAMNGLPGLLGSAVNETFELHRWVQFLLTHLSSWLSHGETVPVAEEIAQLLRSVREALALSTEGDFFRTWDALGSLKERFRDSTRLGVTGVETTLTADEIQNFLQTVQKTLTRGLRKAFGNHELCVTYYVNEVVDFERLPLPVLADPSAPKPAQTVKPLRFRQIPVSAFLEGPMHALRVEKNVGQARKLYRAVKQSELYDRKLKMFKLNLPLTKESFELGRAKIFSPGWLENESVFLHMAYKFLLETLRAGLAEEFFEDFKSGLVAFQDPQRYGRSNLENSSFIASSRFPDARVHGTGFVARLTGATAEWLSMIFFMGLGPQPFRWENETLRFEPRPTLARWLFQRKAKGGFEENCFGFKLFATTWIVYHNPLRQDTYGPQAVVPIRFTAESVDGQKTITEGNSLPSTTAERLRRGELARVTIELGRAAR